VYDLSHPITDGMPVFDGDPAVHVETVATVERDGYRVTGLACGSHTGTHIDAPAHTEPDGATLADLSVERFAFDAVCVDCRDLGALDAIPPERVPDPSNPDRDSTAPDDAPDCVVFHTGWDDHWGTDRYADHPYLAAETARLCAERGFAVATDTASPDPSNPDQPGYADLPAHHALLGSDCLIVENLTGLDAVPERFELRAFPLSLDTDGSPVRAVGVERE
jgi:kynurenine formamidase